MVFIFSEETWMPKSEIHPVAHTRVPHPSISSPTTIPVEFLDITSPPPEVFNEDAMTMGTILNEPVFGNHRGNTPADDDDLDSDSDLDMFEDAEEGDWDSTVSTSSVVIVSRRASSLQNPKAENGFKKRKMDTDSNTGNKPEPMTSTKPKSRPRSLALAHINTTRTQSRNTFFPPSPSLSPSPSPSPSPTLSPEPEDPEELEFELEEPEPNPYSSIPPNWRDLQTAPQPGPSPRTASPPPLFGATSPGLNSISTVSAYLRRKDREEDKHARTALTTLSHADALAELKTLRAQNWELKLENNKYLTQLALARRTIAVKDQDLAHFQKQLASADSTIQKLGYRVEGAEKTVHILNSNLQITGAGIQKLRNELMAKFREVRELRVKAREADAAERKVAKLEREIERMKRVEEKNFRAFA